ncbi:efflux RND transporter periplasmic adaptor subunit [Inhella sp.]|uniref:efflux RND transporter periplasmic adaptor subunit n=1 Tax=Inhella sp. TaxID=1921806 RepID=UPI0035B09ACD
MNRLPFAPASLGPTLAAVALLTACSQAAPPTAPPLRPVYVHAVESATSTETLQATVQSRYEVELGFRSGGRVLERRVDAGARVQSGQLLARLDPTEQQQAVGAARAQLAAAEWDASQQASDASRLARLATDGSVGSADAERQQTGARAAAERVRAAQAQLRLAEERLAHTELRAPFAGVVTVVRAERGQVLPEGQPLLQLAASDALELQIDLPPALAAQAEHLQGEALGRRWRLRELQAAAHPQTRTQRARFAPVGEPLAWKASLLGRTVALPLTGQAAVPRLRVPASSLLPGEPARVWRVVDQRLQALPVHVAGREGDAALISGVPEGSVLVMLGAHRLEAGQAVRPVPMERAP